MRDESIECFNLMRTKGGVCGRLFTKGVMTVRRSPFLSIIVASILACSFAVASAEERILRFDAAAEIRSDASLVVTESIRFVSEGKDIKRGLIRTIPTDFTDAQGKRRRAGFEVLSAEIDGSPTGIKVERSGDGLDIRIGREKTVLTPGEHVIVLAYSTTGQLGFFADHDELYWNVTGNDWAFAIERATFRLKLPGRNFGEGFRSVEVYTGKKGEKRADARTLPDGSVESTKAFPTGEGLTVAVTWPKGIVAPPVNPAPVLEKWTPSPWRALHLAMPVILLALMAAIWFRWGRDPAAKTVIPRFTPPDGVEAGFGRYVRTMRIDDTAFGAMLLGLAVKGCVTIEERSFAADQLANAASGGAAGKALKLLSKLAGRSYRLRLHRERIESASLTADERVLVDELFGSTRSEITLSSADRPVIREAFARLTTSFRARGKQLFASNIGKWSIGVVLFEIYAFTMFIVMMIGKGGVPEPRFEPILAAFAGPFLLLPFAIPLPSGKGTFFMRFFFRILFPGIFLVVMTGLILAGGSSGLDVDPVSAAGPIACVIVLLVFKPLLQRRTVEGARLAEEIEGLRMFITTAEKNRLEITARPDETPQLFETLLPWAFALDAAETWANRFEKVLAASQYTPSWYRGDMRTFSTPAGIAAFASTFSGSVSTGTRSSGSGGSGSSGGGGGGGGGRGW
jgi:hypothetical protein